MPLSVSTDNCIIHFYDIRNPIFMAKGISKNNILFSDIEKTDLSSFYTVNNGMLIENAKSGDVCFEYESFCLWGTYIY